MTDADQTSYPSDMDGPVPEDLPFRSSVSTLVSGVIAIGALSLIRAAIIGPDADQAARLLLLLGGIGVPFSLMAVVSARSAKKYHKTDRQAFAIAVGFAAAAAVVGLVGLGLLLGDASGADYRVPLWQIETEPAVTLLVGLAALALAVSSRFSPSDDESGGSRRIVAVIGACVAMPIVRRLFGRAGDEGLSVGWTILLLVFDLLALAAVAVVAYKGFGVGRDLPAQFRAVRAGEQPENQTAVDPPVEPA